jgi:triosephosphate isomerase (TIM)
LLQAGRAWRGAARLLAALRNLRDDVVRKLIAGNWKMNGTRAILPQLETIAAAASAAPDIDVAIAPPFTLIEEAIKRAGPVAIGAQDCHHNACGAHTGCIAADMIAELGARFVICGHSERRAEFGETNALVRAKAEAALAAGLNLIVCVGEDQREFDAGRTVQVVTEKLAGSIPENVPAERIVVGYEPAWAIGTGRTPTMQQIGDVHGMVRARLIQLHGEEGAKMRVLYGGSVNAGNAATILACPNVNGALVGGASLMAADFVPIIQAAANVSQ